MSLCGYTYVAELLVCEELIFFPSRLLMILYLLCLCRRLSVLTVVLTPASDSKS